MKTSSLIVSTRQHTLRGIAAALALAAAVAAPLANAQAFAQDSTAALKFACENNPGNVVVVATDILIKTGAPADFPEQVATGCRIELLNDASVLFDQVGVAFAGPLEIVGSAKAGVELLDAALTADSVDIRFTAFDGTFMTTNSRIDATAGNLAIAMGSIGKLELLNGRLGGTLVATGNVSVSAANKLSAALNEVGIVAGGNVAIIVNGAESDLKIENAGVESQGGTLAIRMFAEKSVLEVANTRFNAAGNVDLVTGRAESGIGASNVNIASGGRVQILANGGKSAVALSDGSISATTAVVLSAGTAAGAVEGKLEISNFTVGAATPIRMITGVLGSTIVKDSVFTGTGLVQAASDPATGKCESINNRVAAPRPRLCV